MVSAQGGTRTASHRPYNTASPSVPTAERHGEGQAAMQHPSPSALLLSRNLVCHKAPAKRPLY